MKLGHHHRGYGEHHLYLVMATAAALRLRIGVRSEDFTMAGSWMNITRKA